MFPQLFAGFKSRQLHPAWRLEDLRNLRTWSSCMPATHLNLMGTHRPLVIKRDEIDWVFDRIAKVLV